VAFRDEAARGDGPEGARPQPDRTHAALADNTLLDHAFAWLCHRRRHWPDAADVWDVRRRRPAEKRRFQADLRAGHVRLGILTRITNADGTGLDLWSARDAVVLKARVERGFDFLGYPRVSERPRGC
jgi:hypothetical protein